MTKRNTIQRELVMQTATSFTGHPTADDIYCSVTERHPSISKGTVYRNLNELSSEGVLRRVPVPGEADRYDHNSHRHYHIICTKCGAFGDVPLEYADGVDKSVKTATGYTHVRHEVVFSGLCEQCAKAIK